MFNRIKSQKHPIKFLLSRALWYSNLCKIFTIKFASGVKVRFYPTSASASFWIEPFICKDEETFISDYLRDGDTMIDVGANIGYLTLTGAKKIGNNGHVLAIEPHPRTFSFLNKNIKLNGFENIKTYNLAIGNEEGSISFSDSKSDEQNFITKKGPVTVSIKKLDDLFQGNSVELLKIDTEGYELFVLQGALSVLSKTKLIYLESYQTHFDRYNYDKKDILNFLIEQKFKIFIFTSAKELVEIDYSSSLEKFENLVAVSDVPFFKSRLQGYSIK